MAQEKVKVLWSGITGKTASQALKVVNQNKNAIITVGVSRNGKNSYTYENLEDIKEDFDVIVDFSHPESFDQILDFALKRKKPIVIGTSGLTEEQMNRFIKAADIIPVFRGGNFRLEVKDFIDKIVEYAKNCTEDIIPLVEEHYITVNIPSETARVIKKRVLDETGKTVEIHSSNQEATNTNDWRVGNIAYRCGAYDEKLGEDVLNIAAMMKDKMPDGVYDLDRLLEEEKER